MKPTFILITLMISVSLSRCDREFLPFPTAIATCNACQETTVTIIDTWAEQCTSEWEGSQCVCVCGSVSCSNNEIIDRSTCKPDGRLEDCRCISLTTTAPPTTTIGPCDSPACDDTSINIGQTWATQCWLGGEGSDCFCVCGGVFCSSNEIIDTATCKPDGRIEDCRCIFISTTPELTTPISTTPVETTTVDPCNMCRDTTINIGETWAGQCRPVGEASQCVCACVSVFCDDNEIIDRSTCRPDGRLEDCRCISVTTPAPPTTTIGPCHSPACEDTSINIQETWAMQCWLEGEGSDCICVCGAVFCNANEIIDTATCRPDGRIEDCRCIFMSTTTPISTTPVETTTVDPCNMCRDTTINIGETWAGQCRPVGEASQCVCACGSVFCNDNEIIDRSTCRPDGRLEDCRCISVTTPAPPTTTIGPCHSPACEDTSINIQETWAMQCWLEGEGSDCICVCGAVFCNANEIIDTATCRPDGRIEDCRCIFMSTTTPISTTPVETTTVDPCNMCRDTTINIGETWAGQCRPVGEASQCVCACVSVFCDDNEIIDRSTCRPDGRLEDCRCISVTTPAPPTTTIGPCHSPACEDTSINIQETWAMQCWLEGEGSDCICVCGAVFCNANEIIDTATCRPDGRIEDCRCIFMSTTTPISTTPVETTTVDPCNMCRDTTINIGETWAGQCRPVGEASQCVCACGSVFCNDNEIIDRSTCRPDGRLEDCRCISVTTPAPPTTTIGPCHSPACEDTSINIQETWAMQCWLEGEGSDCICVCGAVFCNANEIIDTATCRPDGRIEDCRCIFMSTTTPISTTPVETTTVDPCNMCRDTTINIGETWAGQCRPVGEASQCVCACVSVFCDDNEIIDRSTCRPDGRLEDCRCISVTTPAPPTTTIGPCHSPACEDTSINIQETWATQCWLEGEGSDCICVCGAVFCSANEIIDTATCRPDGEIADCRCILISATSEPTTQISTTPVQTTTVDPCSSCRDTTISITDSWAGQCRPFGEDINCACRCFSIFCRDMEIIDRSTCKPNGTLDDCRCIPV